MAFFTNVVDLEAALSASLSATGRCWQAQIFESLVLEADLVDQSECLILQFTSENYTKYNIASF